MRVLHISHTTRWGAGKALARHHRALVDAGVDSHLLVAQTDWTPHERLHMLETGPASGMAAGIVDGWLAQPWLGAASSMRIHQTGLFQSADIVELRQLHAGREPGFFNLRAVRHMARRKPVIWRLSDAWALTGFCAYHYNCVKWREGCGECPIVGRPELTETLMPRRDVAWINWRLKRRVYAGCAVDVVCPSRWLLDEARASILAHGGTRFHHIPVGVDVRMFGASNRQSARQGLHLANDDVVLLVNAPDLDNYRKGGDILLDVLGRLNHRALVLAVIGDQAPAGMERLFRCVFATGYLDDDAGLAGIYAAADIFLFPSRQDNSAQVLLEAAAAGLPVVCFDVGGNSEYVENGKTGVVVPAFDRKAFAAAVDTLVEDVALRAKFAAAGRTFAGKFTAERQTQSFIRLYEGILKESCHEQSRGKSGE